MLEIAGLRLDPFRREVYRNDRYVALTRKQFAVLEVLVAAEGGVVNTEDLLARVATVNCGPAVATLTIGGRRSPSATASASEAAPEVSRSRSAHR